MKQRRFICVFTGSSPGARAEYRQAADALGRALVEAGYGLVYGGGNVGLMGVIADAVLACSGHVCGVIPRALKLKEVAHGGLTELRVVETMHQRKALMADMADAFVALPGGLGTLEEFFEVLTWGQLGIHAKPCALLNVAGYYDPLLALFDHAVAERFISHEHREMVFVDTDPRALMRRLESYEPPRIEKWLDREET
jgi:hypothetical protein